MRQLTRLLIAASLPALLLVNLSMAAETGSALKNDTMRLEPFADAKITGAFNRGESLEILNKKGAWLQVKTKKSTGWVRLLSIKRGSSGTSNQAAGALAVASGRAGTGQVISTTGIRGLSAEDLKAAKFNETEVKTMESYTQSANQGKQFASAGGLKTVAFPNLKAVDGGSK
ncbi:MAG: SH3 domain-containing protein [Methylotenera sp.]|nr:SH3 domain-containing protein [Methylotenera sp.]